MKNKKGLSSVVAIVLVIGMVISSIAILTPTIMKVAKSPSLSPEVACIEAQSSSAFKIISACHDSLLNETRVSISRSFSSPKPELINFNFQISDSKSSTYQAGGPSCEHCLLPEAGESKTYYFDQKIKPLSVNLNVYSCNLGQRDIINC